MINLHCTNTKKQGDVGVGAAIGWFAKNHYTVLIPLTDSQEYDLVVEKDNILQTVQVKTTRSKKRDVYQVSLRTNGGNRSGSGVQKMFNHEVNDILFVLAEDESMYVIPTSAFKAKTTLSLCSKYNAFIVN